VSAIMLACSIAAVWFVKIVLDSYDLFFLHLTLHRSWGKPPSCELNSLVRTIHFNMRQSKS
jgi:hypothetical protein